MILKTWHIFIFIGFFINSIISNGQEKILLENDTLFGVTKKDSVLKKYSLITFRSTNGKKIAYNGIPIGNTKLRQLIYEYPIVEKRETLMMEFRKMKRYQNRYWPELAAGLALTGGTMFLGTILAWAFHDSYVLQIPIAASVIILAITLPLSISAKHKFLKKRKKLVSLYNNSLP